MNFNAIIAVLILKSVITEDEGQRLVEHLNDKPQSTVLRDAVAAVAEVIGKPQPLVQAPLGPVGPAQQAEELAARSQAVQQPILDAAHVEPQLAANEATLDSDQASDTASGDQAASNEKTKTTSDNKPKGSAKKK